MPESLITFGRNRRSRCPGIRKEAAENRLAMRVGVLSRPLTPLLLLQLRPRLGVSAADLRPVEAITDVRCPVLVMAGTADQHTTETQTRALFAAANEPKELWLVPGASHDDLFRHDRRGYSDHVLSFLRRHLARPPLVTDAGEASRPVGVGGRASEGT